MQRMQKKKKKKKKLKIPMEGLKRNFPSKFN